MDIESYREYCLSLDNVSESFPFGDDTIVFKVYDKMFSLAGMTVFECFKIKNEPAINIELREHYPEITPGFHMNKQHWSDVSVKGNLSDQFMKELLLNSYHIVLQKVPKRVKESVNHYKIR